jgi:hypothetical protein
VRVRIERMNERDCFYANGMTFVLSPSEGILRFMRKVPVFDDDGEIVSEKVEEAINIIMPSSMLQDMPDFMESALSGNNDNPDEVLEELKADG